MKTFLPKTVFFLKLILLWGFWGAGETDWLNAAEMLSEASTLSDLPSFTDSPSFADSPSSSSPLSPKVQAFYYQQALANYDQNWRRLQREGGTPWSIFSVRMPANYLYALASVELFFRRNPDLRVDCFSSRAIPMAEAQSVVTWIRTMQELAKGSPFQGNFRWYWKQSAVEDRNAVEFVVQRLIFCWFHRKALPESCWEPIREILRDAAPECLRRTVRPAYTNIAVLNFSNLILLGEALEEPALCEEGARRMNRFVFRTWKYGINEFGTSTYFTTVFEALEQLKNLTRNETVRQKALALLDFWSLVTALHWTEDGTFSGACSRTYDYLYGDPYLRFHAGVWGWCALPAGKSEITILTALNGNYQPSPEIRKFLTTEKNSGLTFPCTLCEHWGEKANQWKKTFRTPDFSVGTSASEYGSHQDQLWSVDWRKTGPNDPNPRSFFAADGRGDPWGTARELTSGGHQKALHLDPQWRASQHESFTQCEVTYPAEMVQQFRAQNPDACLRSTFVLKRPDEFQFRTPRELHLRYENYWLQIELESAPEAEISQTLLPSPDGNAVAWCVTHRSEGETELKFRSVIRNSHPKSSLPENAVPENVWPESTAAPITAASHAARSNANPYLNSVFGRALLSPWELEFEPEFPAQAGPADILVVNGQGVGRAFLEERLPELREFSQKASLWACEFTQTPPTQPSSPKETPNAENSDSRARPDAARIPLLALNPGETLAVSALSGLFFDAFRTSETSIAIQSETFFRFWVRTPGRYQLSAKILAPDPKRDSIQLTYWSAFPPAKTHFPCWALGSSPDWRTVEFRVPDSHAPQATLNLPAGPVLLRLAPREFDVQLEKLFLKRLPDE